jgi:hypothetical protein
VPALLATAAALLAAGAALAGCGSSGSGNADPATVTPASAPLYAKIAIKPQGGANGNAASAAKKLTHLAEPYGSLAQALLSSKGSRLEFKRDIEPWVGDSAGVFVTSLDTGALPQSATSAQGLLEGGLTSGLSALGAGTFGKGTQGAIVLDTSNLGGARSFLAQRAREQQAHAASYRGVSYQASADGAAEGIVKNFAVIGSESGLKSVIDTSLGGAAVTTAPGYAKAPANAIASAYVQPEALLKAVHGSSGATSQGVSLLGQLFAGSQSASLSVTPTANSISLQGEVHSASGSTPLFGQEGAKALGELPGGAWLAAGVGSTGGANLPRALALLRGVASLGTSTVFASLGGAGIEKLFAALSSPNAKLQQDFGSWAGPAGMFVSGTGLFNLEAALVIASNDPSASRAAVGKLANLMRSAGAVVSNASIAGTDAAVSVKLQGFPAVIFIADGQGKFVLGLGQASVQGALSPSSTLASSSAYSTATATLGGGIEPSLIVEFPTLLGFLEGVGLTQSPGVSNLVPYLKSLGTLTAGATSQSGVEHFRLVLGLA